MAALFQGIEGTKTGLPHIKLHSPLQWARLRVKSGALEPALQFAEWPDVAAAWVNPTQRMTQVTLPGSVLWREDLQLEEVICSCYSCRYFCSACLLYGAVWGHQEDSGLYETSKCFGYLWINWATWNHGRKEIKGGSLILDARLKIPMSAPAGLGATPSYQIPTESLVAFHRFLLLSFSLRGFKITTAEVPRLGELESITLSLLNMKRLQSIL